VSAVDTVATALLLVSLRRKRADSKLRPRPVKSEARRQAVAA